MKCFLDANVLFSASNQSSQIHRLLKELESRQVWITSDYAREEARRNIRSKRAAWADGFDQIMENIDVVPSVDRLLEVEIATKERPILATAIAESCDRLITGDKRDFGHLFQKTINGVTILTPLQLTLELVETRH